MPMTAVEQLAIRVAIEDLNSAFAYYLDHNQVEPLVDLFTADARYIHGERRTEGREALRALFIARTSAGVRTTRHFYSGLRLQVHDERNASGQSVCMLFAANQTPPIGFCAPQLVADFVDRYVREADGRWRIAQRDIERVFAADTEAHSPVTAAQG
jgi:ketosteroid isomerase-like protein